MKGDRTMDLQTLERARMYMEKLANGINPIDNSLVPDNDIVNNVRLSRCFFYVADVLKQVIDNGGISATTAHQKQVFSLPTEKRGEFAFSQEPITISEIVRRINQLVDSENMLQLTHTMVTAWLMEIGALTNEVNAEGKNVKRPTPHGVSLGITTRERTGLNGIYYAVVYDIQAQHFILDNLDAALEHHRAKTENQGKPWTAEHDQLLREMHAKNLPAAEIAAALQRNTGSIRSRLRKLGIVQ